MSMRACSAACVNNPTMRLSAAWHANLLERRLKEALQPACLTGSDYSCLKASADRDQVFFWRGIRDANIG